MIQKPERVAQEWRAVFDSVPDFVSIHDTEFNVVRVNRALAEVLKAKPADLIGKKCYQIMHGTNECWPDCPHRNTLESKKTSRCELYEPHLGLNLDIITSPILNKQRKIVGTVHVARDITWRKQSEEILREEKERYRSIADMLPQIVFEVDANLMVTFANRQAKEISGYSSEDFEKGVNGLQLLSPGIRKKGMKDAEEMLNNMSGGYFEFTFRRKDGTTFPAGVFINPLVIGGKTTGLSGLAIDLTEWKKLEQLKDDFIGMVSHELRSPLTTIMGSVNLVRKAGSRMPKKEVQQLLNDAASAADDLSKTLTNLLEISRIKGERLVLHLEEVNLRNKTREIIKKIRPRSPKHQFVMDFQPGRLNVPADPLRLEHTLRNLIENAVKYSPKGGEIRVTVRKSEAEYIIGVSDQGIGIAEADRARLFAPFQRLEELKTAGVGLGLLVCRRLVEAHRGRIWVESIHGHGSTFFFTIPLKQG